MTTRQDGRTDLYKHKRGARGLIAYQSMCRSGHSIVTGHFRSLSNDLDRSRVSGYLRETGAKHKTKTETKTKVTRTTMTGRSFASHFSGRYVRTSDRRSRVSLCSIGGVTWSSGLARRSVAPVSDCTRWKKRGSQEAWLSGPFSTPARVEGIWRLWSDENQIVFM